MMIVLYSDVQLPICLSASIHFSVLASSRAKGTQELTLTIDHALAGQETVTFLFSMMCDDEQTMWKFQLFSREYMEEEARPSKSERETEQTTQKLFHEKIIIL
jgi:hypothetical protein